MEKYSVRGKTLDFFKSYLSDNVKKLIHISAFEGL